MLGHCQALKIWDNHIPCSCDHTIGKGREFKATNLRGTNSLPETEATAVKRRRKFETREIMYVRMLSTRGRILGSFRFALYPLVSAPLLSGKVSAHHLPWATTCLFTTFFGETVSVHILHITEIARHWTNSFTRYRRRMNHVHHAASCTHNC